VAFQRPFSCFPSKRVCAPASLFVANFFQLLCSSSDPLSSNFPNLRNYRLYPSFSHRRFGPDCLPLPPRPRLPCSANTLSRNLCLTAHLRNDHHHLVSDLHDTELQTRGTIGRLYTNKGTQLGESRIGSTAAVLIPRWIARGPSRTEGRKMGTGQISVKGCLGETGLGQVPRSKLSKSMLVCSSRWQSLYSWSRHANNFTLSGRLTL
jgi:hypothetical protein